MSFLETDSSGRCHQRLSISDYDLLRTTHLQTVAEPAAAYLGITAQSLSMRALQFQVGKNLLHRSEKTVITYKSCLDLGHHTPPVAAGCKAAADAGVAIPG